MVGAGGGYSNFMGKKIFSSLFCIDCGLPQFLNCPRCGTLITAQCVWELEEAEKKKSSTWSWLFFGILGIVALYLLN